MMYVDSGSRSVKDRIHGRAGDARHVRNCPAATVSLNPPPEQDAKRRAEGRQAILDSPKEDLILKF